ncbi:GTP 3',8-cyclase MoaA [Thermodesulfitimonas sp.]
MVKERQRVDYLRISVTDRCNLRCRYCLPAEGVPVVPHAEVLRHEEITAIVQAAAAVGIKKVRLTGGEPLVRGGIVELVAMLAAVPGIDDVALTTNGILFSEMAAALKRAGLRRVNISLDTLRPERYAWITRGGNLQRVLTAVETALALGLHPVKLNVVVLKGFNDDEITDMARLSVERPLHVRFIELMPFGPAGALQNKWFLPTQEVRARLEARFGPFITIRKLAGCGPARYYRIPGAAGTIGFINGVTGHFCSRCNRLRLTATGELRTCLFGGPGVNLKGPLRAGADRAGIGALIREAIEKKAGARAKTARLGVMARLGG